MRWMEFYFHNILAVRQPVFHVVVASVFQLTSYRIVPYVPPKSINFFNKYHINVFLRFPSKWVS